VEITYIYVRRMDFTITLLNIRICALFFLAVRMTYKNDVYVEHTKRILWYGILIHTYLPYLQKFVILFIRLWLIFTFTNTKLVPVRSCILPINLVENYLIFRYHTFYVVDSTNLLISSVNYVMASLLNYSCNRKLLGMREHSASFAT
jgi:hypothetical protein